MKKRIAQVKKYCPKYSKNQILGLFFLITLIITASCSVVIVYHKKHEQSLPAQRLDTKESLEIDTETDSLPADELEDEAQDEIKLTEEPEDEKEEEYAPPKETNPTTNKEALPSEPSTPPDPIQEPEPQPTYPPITVAFYADNQSDTDEEDAIHQRTVNNILNSGANPVFHAGDLMEDGTQDSLNRFNSVTATMRSTRTFYAALGNNDRLEGDSSTPSPLFLNNFVFPNNERWYSVNYGNLHMVVLDSAFASSSQAQKDWLANDLQSAASQDRITGVIFHHPAFASTISSYLTNYGVDFVIMGHEHTYRHFVSDGIHHFVLSGRPGLGHIVADISTDSVIMTVYNNSNGQVDRVSFSAR